MTTTSPVPPAPPVPHVAHVPRIVIVGGGVGGLALATRLGDSLGRQGKAEITLIDYARTHVWKPLYHQVAAGALDPSVDQVEYLAQAKWHHFQFRQGRLDAVDRAAQTVQLAATYDEAGECIIPSRVFSYDILVLSLGSISNDFGVTGVREHAHFLDTLEQANRFNTQFVNAYLQAQLQPTPLRPGQLRLAIVGTGATGVELAAELHATAKQLASYSYGLDKIDSSRQMQITLIGGPPTILPGLPERLINATMRELQQLGIECLTGEWVTEVTPEGVKTKSGRFIASEFTVWAGGIKAPDVLTQIAGLETNKLNQLLVQPTLQTTQDAGIFALGDCAAAHWKDGINVPPRAQAANEQADFMVKAIQAYLAQKPLPEFEYRDYGSLVSLGEYSTVGSLMGSLTKGSLFIEGHIARAVYTMLYKRHQSTIHGLGRTMVLTLSDMLRRRVKPRIKLH